jgi:hypothetical protein
MIPFNNKKHSDITVTISEGDCAVDETRVFYLHKFPLISKSVYFDLHIPLPAEPNAAATVDMKISHFPGGPNAFEMVARYCYGLDIELNVDNIAPVYCAARVLQVADLEKSTEDYMQTFVLTDIVKAATVLKITAGISNMTEAMMAGLVGHCINAIAARFAVIPELSSLPPECFVVVVKTARDMDAPKRVLEQAVLAYLKAHISPETGASPRGLLGRHGGGPAGDSPPLPFSLRTLSPPSPPPPSPCRRPANRGGLPQRRRRPRQARRHAPLRVALLLPRHDAQRAQGRHGGGGPVPRPPRARLLGFPPPCRHRGGLPRQEHPRPLLHRRAHGREPPHDQECVEG